MQDEVLVKEQSQMCVVLHKKTEILQSDKMIVRKVISHEVEKEVLSITVAFNDWNSCNYINYSGIL